MRRIFAATLFATASSLSLAQGIYPYLTSKQEGAFLVSIEAIQKEVKATPEQAAAWQKVLVKHLADQEQMLKDAKPDMKEPEAQAFQKSLENLDIKDADAILAIAKPDQVGRVRQIELQQLGLEAFGKADVLQELGVVGALKDKIDELRNGWLKAFDDSSEAIAKKASVLPEPEGGNKEALEKREKAMAAIIEDAKKDESELNRAKALLLEKVVAMLTAEQQTKWKEMLGKPFNMKNPGNVVIGKEG